jgi:Cd2+/Zn2+-exporting ATPase
VTTLLGITGLWIAILADTGATVLVTMNALRLLFFRPSVAIDTPQHASHDNGNTRSDRVSATT